MSLDVSCISRPESPPLREDSPPSEIDFLKIRTPLKDVAALCNKPASFKCRVEGLITSFKWYKDGKLILKDDNIKITLTDKCAFVLDILCVTNRDQGMYLFMASNEESFTTSCANLYVASNHKICNYEGSVYLPPVPRQYLRVNKHFTFTRVKVGEAVNLRAEFVADTIDFVWTKSNQELTSNSHLSIISEENTTELTIDRAVLEDSGLYNVISITAYGILTCHANVQVIEENGKIFIDSENIPSIEEFFAEDAEINANEESRLVCKINSDQNTIVRFYIGEKEIHSTGLVCTEYYGCNYYGLRWKNPSRFHSSEYTLKVTDSKTNRTEIMKSKIYVAQPELSLIASPPPVHLLRPLESVAAVVGARVVFQCSFRVLDYPYFYVVWYVGRCRIERTNTFFKVISNGGDNVLYIPSLEADMSGEVMCELRRAIPNQKSALVIRTTAYLTTVPPLFLSKFLIPNSTLKAGRFYMNDLDQRDSENEKPEDKGAAEPPTIKPKAMLGKVIMETIFCSSFTSRVWIALDCGCDSYRHISSGSRTREIKELYTYFVYRVEQDGYYYANIVDTCGKLQQRVTVEMVQQVEGDTVKSIYTVYFKWDLGREQGIWYLIEMSQTNGAFAVIAYCSEPSFQLHDPIVGRIIHLRVTACEPLSERVNVKVSINIPKPVEPPATNPASVELKEARLYQDYYEHTADFIGRGTFGTVTLVKCKADQKYYAAKTIRTRLAKQRSSAMREFELMMHLQHPKLVQLQDGFVDCSSFICVMEYLWGGELFQRIANEDHLKEADVVPYVQQLLEALVYLHDQKIVHLDIKPENIICTSPNDELIKLVDFGVARKLSENISTRAIYGTRDYVAPEIINYDCISFACDMWSTGVLTFLMLSGNLPFSGADWNERSVNINLGNYSFYDPAFDEISNAAKDFVKNLLMLNPEQRMTAIAALKHPWVRQGPPEADASPTLQLTRKNLRTYLQNYSKQRWQRAGRVMIAAHRLRLGADRKNNNEDAFLEESSEDERFWTDSSSYDNSYP